MSRPYVESDRAWLENNSAVFQDVLESTSHFRATLRKLEAIFSPAGGNLLDFVEVSPGDVERCLRVCDTIMKGLGPTAEGMRRELQNRDSE